MSPLPSSRIAAINDTLRMNFAVAPHKVPGAFRVLITQGVGTLNRAQFSKLIRAVENYSAFGEANDPHGEHDFGSIDQDGHRFFWKIDYYDLACEAGSPDPADTTLTCRMLTIMRADEY